MLVCGLLASAGLAAAQTASVAALAQTESGRASAASPVPTAAAPPVYFAAEEMPAFPGGNPALLTFLSRKTNYPTEALDRSISGKVHITFVVDADGHLRDPQVVRGLGYGLDEEALRLVRIMPWWTPGRINGQPVWVRVTLPIAFRAL